MIIPLSTLSEQSADTPFPKRCAMNAAKKAVHILVPVWGEKYISAFMRTSMPALLTPGNIPALAGECDLTVVFLTTRESARAFSQQPCYVLLQQYCNIELEYIEDLIAGSKSYAVPLTLAFVRGITRTGPAMTQTWFIFYNADFILADGGLATIWRHICQGKDIILATSFRVTAEEAEPYIASLADAQGMLPPLNARHMASWALRHMHHTVESRIFNQEVYNAHYWNQIYWRVDEQTLLARYFLATQFCLRPTVYMKSVSSFFDYSLLQEFCPGGAMTAITDSDEFFMMELQSFYQELPFLKPGRPSLEYTADSVGRWTADIHRKTATFETLIHGGEAPAALAEHRAAFHDLMQSLFRRLPVKAVEPSSHFHWIGALQWWTRCKLRYDKELGAENMPFSGLHMPQTRLDSTYYKEIQGKQQWAAMHVLGIFPRIFPWHPLWYNHRVLQRHMQELLAGGDVLHIADSFDYDPLPDRKEAVSKIFSADFMHGHVEELYPGKTFAAYIVTVDYNHTFTAQAVLNAIAAHGAGDKKVLFYWGRTMKRLSGKDEHFMDSYYHLRQVLDALGAKYQLLGNMCAVRLLSKVLKAAARIRVNWLVHSLQLLGYSMACLGNNIACVFRPEKNPAAFTGMMATLVLKEKGKS